MTFSGYDWIPTLNDVEYWKAHGTAEEQAYYGDFGWEKLVVPASATHVAADMAALKTLFVGRYGFRRLNAETMERWQIRLQNTFDQWVQDMERALTLYDTHSATMLSDIIRGTETSNSGTDTSADSRKTIDTPDTAINASDSYADTLSKGSSTITHGHKIEMKVKGETLERVNNFVDRYKDIDQEFIKKFENNFLNVFDYIEVYHYA